MVNLLPIGRSWKRALATLAIVAVVLMPVAVTASHQFSDVPTSNIFHDDIGWLADAGITQGCNPPTNDKFCPDDNVTRQQMAAFMRRLAESQAVDAGTLDGHTAQELSSHAYTVTSSNASVPGTGIPETLVELAGLPAGSYVIVAKTFLTYLGGDGQGPTECHLVADSQKDVLRATVVNLHHLPATMTLVHTFAGENNKVELRCAHTGGGDETISETKITAISVGSIVSTTL